jgi:hypothetical protein
MDDADDAAATVGGYTARQAAHAFEEYLEGHLSLRGFTQWLEGYRPGPSTPSDPEVEDEINQATLAIRSWQHGTRTRQEVHQELREARSRLTGLSRQ